jgi:membrane protease subunit (stomatin/prohibitin family)
MRTFSMYFVNALQDVVGDILVQRKVGALDLGTMSRSLKDDVITQTKATLDRYGMAIRLFNDLHLTLDPESHEKISKLTETAAYSNLAGGYQQYAAGQALMSAAENPGQGGGGAMGMGMGLGAGMSMGNMFTAAAAGARPGGAAPTVNCLKCGAQVAPGRFCASCGAELPTGNQPAAAASRSSRARPSARSAGRRRRRRLRCGSTSSRPISASARALPIGFRRSPRCLATRRARFA